MAADVNDIAGKHALVTGGSRGIGLAVATALVEHGARVSVVSRTALAAPGLDRCFRAEADVSEEDQVAHALERAREANGPIAILVNNSGIAQSAPVVRTSRAMWDRIIATNLTGAFLCTRTVLPDMIAAKWGRIVNVASTAGLFGAAYVAAYCASKHGLVGLTRAIAAEFEGSGITVNAVCPGYTETDMLAQALRNITTFTGASEGEARARLASTSPEGRIATTAEVAAAVLALITGTCNGQAVIVPGGAIA